MSYKIGSFNMRNLNFNEKYEKDENKVKREFAIIAKIIEDGKFDVIAMQEVLSENALKMILKNFGARSNWDYRWEKPNAYTGGENADKRGEGYAYLWNTKRLNLSTTLTSAGIRVAEPQIWKQYVKNGARIIREPYYARFTPNGTVGGTFFELRLINTHIVFGDNTKGKKELRKNEYSKIAQSIYPKIADKVYGNNMLAYTVILGDYNLEMGDIDIIEVDEKEGKRTIITLQEQLTSLNRRKQEDGTFKSDGYASNYDHFSVDKKFISSARIKTARVDAVDKYFNEDPDSFESYWTKISDHVPIKMAIDLNNRRQIIISEDF